MPIEIDWNEVTELQSRLERCEIQDGDCQREVTEAQKISLERYARNMFGFKTESARKIKGKKKEAGDSDSAKPYKEKPKGHGRNGVSEYPGVLRLTLSEPESLKLFESVEAF